MQGRWSIILPTVRSDLPAGENFEIDIGGTRIVVRVRRHHASRRYRLRYHAVDGELRLTLPLRQRLGPARAWVTEQSGWIVRQMAARPAGGVFVTDGTMIPWHDGDIRVCWDEHMPRSVQIDQGRLMVGGEKTSIGPRLRRWLQAEARLEFGERSRAMAQAEQLPLTTVSVGDPRSRWGSCSASGAIRYSWRLVMAPDDVRHAIVAHEVAHLAHMNHGPRFHALADRLGGAANARSRDWLKANGARLHALRFDSA